MGAAETVGAADEPAEDIARAVVGGRRAIGHQEGYGPGVVCHDAQGDVELRVAAIGHGRSAAHRGEGLGGTLDEGCELVRVRRPQLVLHHNRQALEAHARINARLRQRGERAVGALGVLLEDDVPDLEVTVAVAADGAIGLTAARLRAHVDVDLRAGAAGPLPALLGPPIVLAAEADNAVARDADTLAPDGLGLVVGLEDGDPHEVGGDAHVLGQKLPGELAAALLEVVAEREVAEHLEERMVARLSADAVKVAHAGALLAARGARGRGRFLTAEGGDVRLHAGGGEERRRVVGDERSAGANQVIMAPEVVEERVSEFVDGHWCFCLPTSGGRRQARRLPHDSVGSRDPTYSDR